MAQKQFTLEDLNFGGTNYRKFVPENCYTAWWGDELMKLDAEECSIINKVSGKESVLFTLADANKWLDTDAADKVHSLYRATFPYGDKPLVLLHTKNRMYLLNWKKHRVEWQMATNGSATWQAEAWNKVSKALAYVKDNQLMVKTQDGDSTQLTTDGSRCIVYGQSVHRDEFGIQSGLFWSPDGTKLAFYRMDQTMVADYPQVDIFHRIALYEPDKYPMAGETSHKVTVMVYDLQSKNITTLQAGDPTDRFLLMYRGIRTAKQSTYSNSTAIKTTAGW